MIDKRELKLGNWINLKGKLNKIVPYDFVYYADRDFEPVSLTEEIFLNAGFELKVTECGGPIGGTSDDYYLDGYGFTKTHGDDTWYLLGYNWNTKRFKYVHELQNLYFALSGDELAITFN